jgi:UDP-glucose 4-epimerase
MRILVTGGAGFIGSHVVDALVGRGDEVTVLDDLSSGKREWVNEAARFVEADLREAPRLFDEIPFETVVHTAAQKNLRVSVEDPLHDAEVNVLGSLVLLEASRKAGSYLVFTSTGGAMYPDGAPVPTSEETAPGPPSPYGVAKRSFELYLSAYAETHGVRSCSLRLANVYGPRQDPLGEAGVVAIFAEKLLAGEAPRIFGDGEQTRDYVYVADVVSSVLAAAEKRASGIYNIGTGVETSVNRLTALLLELTGSSLQPQHVDAVAGELRRSSLDASLAARDLGWSPATSLEDGFRRTVEWFRERQGS